ncbi:MAG: hypothetical protein Q8N96_04665 [Methylovulum sp.]|nr:hypothetical protein [Methylovulum sp.]
MSSEAIATVVKMMGTLPDATQNQIIEHLQSYVADLQDELSWDEAFAKTQDNLIQKAWLAKQQIKEGLAQPLNSDDL